MTASMRRSAAAWRRWSSASSRRIASSSLTCLFLSAPAHSAGTSRLERPCDKPGRTRWRYALAAAVLLLAAACGDDSGSATTTTTEATTTTAEVTTTTISEAGLGIAMQNLAEEMCRRFDENGTSDLVADGVYSATQAAVDTYPASQRELAKSQFFVFFIQQCDYAVPYGQAQQRAK